MFLDHPAQQGEQEHREHDQGHHAVQPVPLQEESENRNSDPENRDGDQHEEPELDDRLAAKRKRRLYDAARPLQEGRLPWKTP